MTLTITCQFPDDAKARVRTALKLLGASQVRISVADVNPVNSGKRPDTLPTSPEALSVADLFHRGHDTEWSDKEIKAFKTVKKRGVLTLESMAVIAKHYTSERKKPQHYCRRDLLTFLNHFDGELDRARAAKPVASKALEWTDSTPKITVLPDPVKDEEIRQKAREQAAAFRSNHG